MPFAVICANSPLVKGTCKADKNIHGDFVLDGQYILHLAVVALGENVVAVQGVDQLGRDPHLVSGLANAAFST